MQDSDIVIKVGFGDSFEELTIRMPEGDVPPYQPGDDLRLVGTSPPREDAIAKVTGRARFTYDQQPKGLLYGRILRSHHANANITKVDTSEAEKMPGVKAVLSFPDRFRTNSVRYAGTGVAAVAAETEAQAEAAVRKIQVDYEVLPFSVTREDSMADGAPQVGRGDQENLVVGGRRRRRNRGPSEAEVLQAIAGADHRVSGVFETQVHTHSPLETHGVVCEWDDEKLICHASTQATFGVQRELTRAVQPGQGVQVLGEFVGGGFGSKFSAGREGVAGALLAKQAGAPVRMMLDRREEQTDAGNRPDSKQAIQMGLNKDGSIAGYHSRVWGTAGTGRGGAGARNDAIYNLGKVNKVETTVRTNCGGARALRAPGWPQGVFALEAMMDLGADAIGMDPIDFRKKNDGHTIRPAEYDIARKRAGWDDKRQKTPGAQKGPIKTGLGVGSSLWFAAGGKGAAVTIRIHQNATVEVRNGCQDIGTGTRTIMGMCAAEELGLELKDVQTFIGDTNDPRGPGSGGSTTAPTLTPAARLAGFRAREALLRVVAGAMDWTADELHLKGGQVVRKDGAALPRQLSFRQACALIDEDMLEITENGRGSYEGLDSTNAGVQIAEVEVDTETGEVRVKKVTAVADAGKIINPMLAESQVRGGIILGVSYALFERRQMDRIQGRMLNADLENYKILGAVDCPEMDVVLLDVYMGRNNTNVMGLGEPPVVATAGAIANAVHNAIGVRITSLPITPKKVLAALAGKEARL